jgi:outer membrane protein assembly factor BamB
MLKTVFDSLIATAILAGTVWAADDKEEFWAAAKRGDVQTVIALLAKGVDVNAKTTYGATALSFAADKGQLDVVKLLIKNKANVNTRDTFYNATPLTWAYSHEHVEIIKALLEAGAEDAGTLLTLAASQGKLKLVQAILDKGKLKPESLSSALAATPADKPAVAEALKKAGAKPAAMPAVKVDAATLKRYEGTYEDQGQAFQVVVEGGKLACKVEGRTILRLSAVDKNTFKDPANPNSSFTFPSDKDKVTGLKLKRGSMEVLFKRVDSSKAATAKAGPDPKTLPVDDKPTVVSGPKNWPSFRGQNASGNGDGQAPPVTWDLEKGLNVQWKTPIPGLGHSSPVVWEDRVFVTTAISGDPKSLFKPGQYGDVDSVNDTTVHQFSVYCLDKRTGKFLWERTAHQGVPKVKRHTKSSHANPTPATDGKHVIACFGSEGLYCYDVTGKLLWKKDLGVLDSGWFYDADYQWGFASSPIIFKGLVIVQCDIGKNSFIAAYKVVSGDRAWVTPREEVPSWGTPTVYEGKPRDELVANATKFIRGYDPLTGKELWKLGRNSEVTVGTPVTGQGLIFVTGGYPPVRPIYAIKPGGRGDISPAKGKTAGDFVAWSKTKDGTYMPSPIVYGDCLYTCNNNGLITCYDAKSGKQHYQRRIGGRGGFTASPIAADRKLYFTSEEGGTLVVKAGPEYQLLATNPAGDVCMATPAISDGMLFLRTQHHLYGLARTRTASVQTPAAAKN